MASISELKVLNEKKAEVKETPAPALEPQPVAPGKDNGTHLYLNNIS